MPDLILYLLKVNIALVLFYLVYRFVLRRLTFYNLNRCFLIFGILFSIVYPFVDLTEFTAQNPQLTEKLVIVSAPWPTVTHAPTQTPAFNLWQLPVYIFATGAAVMLLRFLLQILSLYKLHTQSIKSRLLEFDFRRVQEDVNPFSFWQTIYLNPGTLHTTELVPILRHEQVHVKGWHTLDVLLFELLTIFSWFNPGVWFMKSAMKQNLEFIADRKVLQSGLDSKAYQYSLIRVSSLSQGTALANNFNFLTIKKRIAMMNKNPSTRANLLRFLVVFPVAAVLVVVFNSVAQTTENQQLKEPVITRVVTEVPIEKSKEYMEVAPKVFIKNSLNLEYVVWQATTETLIIKPKGHQEESYRIKNEQDVATATQKYGLRLTAPDKAKSITQTEEHLFILEDNPYYQNKANLPQDYKAFLKRNPTIEKVGWKFDNEQDFNLQSIVIYLKSGGSEVYNYSDSKSIATAKSKYGELPNLPPPPPPVPAKEELPPPPPPAPSKEQLPPPPPPVKQDTPHPSILLEDQNSITCIFRPASMTSDELNAAHSAFKEKGFKFSFNKSFSNGKLSGIELALFSQDESGKLTGSYNLEELKKEKRVIVLQANKLTQHLSISTQPED
ncbi:M56 family metallopeptidase [Pontibacter sp. SGAir0037]|uniref:M56 family metallopeptidase n=1 Tax=Pontibacter sp. SGAir0037 TaxID=2571030 RepID=UPI0010CD5ABA|nr:M56 family metallopeptidase [Pontibacter sp. SGAir0037]QCR23402.1 hypothetical protein C1N53_14345 [Pontibacter sp. SGAir0037]